MKPTWSCFQGVSSKSPNEARRSGPNVQSPLIPVLSFLCGTNNNQSLDTVFKWRCTSTVSNEYPDNLLSAQPKREDIVKEANCHTRAPNESSVPLLFYFAQYIRVRQQWRWACNLRNLYTRLYQAPFQLRLTTSLLATECISHEGPRFFTLVQPWRTSMSCVLVFVCKGEKGTI